MKKELNQLRSGVVLSYVNLFLGSIIPFFYTPLMLRMLGEAEHGLYSISNSIIGYLSLLSLGIGGTIIRYIAKYRAEKNQDAIERIIGFFLMIYLVIGVVTMACGWGLAENVGSIFAQGLTEKELAKVRILVLIMSFNMAVSFPLGVFTSVVLAYERYVFRRVIDIFTTVATPCLNLVVLYMGFASVGMAAASILMGILTLPLNVIYCYRVLKIHPKFAKIPMELVREIITFSFFIFLGSVVDMMFWATDKIILGMLVSSAAVSVYQVGSTFNQIVMQLSTSVSGVLAPKITGMVVTNTPKNELTDLFIRVGRLQFLVIGLIVSGFIAFGQAFVRLWVGPSYADAYWIAVLTLVPLSIPLIQNTGLSIVIAQNKHRFRAIIYFVIAVLNVVSTYLITPYLGGIGAALCSCISYVLGQGIIMNIYYYRAINLNIPLFWKNILKMGILPAVMMAAVIYIQTILPIRSWISFFAGVILYTGIYGVGMYLWNMNPYEKEIVSHFLPMRK